MLPVLVGGNNGLAPGSRMFAFLGALAFAFLGALAFAFLGALAFAFLGALAFAFLEALAFAFLGALALAFAFLGAMLPPPRVSRWLIIRKYAGDPASCCFCVFPEAGRLVRVDLGDDPPPQLGLEILVWD